MQRKMNQAHIAANILEVNIGKLSGIEKSVTRAQMPKLTTIVAIMTWIDSTLSTRNLWGLVMTQTYSRGIKRAMQNKPTLT